MKIAWSIKIPTGARLKVKNGESIREGDVVYECHQNIIKRLPLVGWQNLGLDQRKTILQNILKRNLVKDEVLSKSGWFSNIILKSPGKGRCLGVDEFGNIELETELDERYISPISADKIRVEKIKVVFELKGEEYEVEGINQLKSWGDFDSRIIDDLDQLSSDDEGKVVIIDGSLDAATKAEAIGVAGLVLIDFNKVKEFEDSDIPVVLMKKDEAARLIKNDGAKIWINATTGKLLVVLE